MEALLKKRVKVVEYDAEATKFVTNLCAPAKIASVVVEGDTATITPVDFQNRGLIIGKNANILRKYEMITKRYFPIEHLRVATVEEKI